MLRLPPVLRPRWSWKYILCSIIILYVTYCFLFSSPLFASNLPRYTGPYEVGAVDLEVPCDGRATSDFKLRANGNYAFKLDTVLFTLYYPAREGIQSSKPLHYWIPKPISLTAEGFLTLGRVNNFLTNGILTGALWGLVGSITIPAKVDVPLSNNFLLARSQYPMINSDTSSDKEGSSHFPILVFSHGFASSRTDYTHYIGELASRGYIVAALEHRDGSSPGSTVMQKTVKNRDVFPMKLGDMINKNGRDMADFKAAQLDFRQAEVEETVRVLREINDGKGADIFRLNPRNEGKDLESWKSKLDMDQVTVGGHSFGATLVLQALKGSPEASSRPFKGGIALDPGKSSGQLNTDVNVPILVIHSNSWSSKHSIFFGRPHFDVVKDLVQSVVDKGKKAWFLTSLGTSHPSVTDAPLIEPLLLSWTTGSTIDAKEGVHQYVMVSEEFLRYQRTSIVPSSGLLSLPVSHSEYDMPLENGKKEKQKDQRWRKFWQIHVAPKSE